MRSFGGEIKCQSEVEQWTRFDDVPIFGFKYSERIKSELTKLKTVLIVSDQKDSWPVKWPRYRAFMGFELAVLDVASALKNKYQFRFDLIFVDMEAWTYRPVA